MNQKSLKTFYSFTMKYHEILLPYTFTINFFYILSKQYFWLICLAHHKISNALPKTQFFKENIFYTHFERADHLVH